MRYWLWAAVMVGFFSACSSRSGLIKGGDLSLAPKERSTLFVAGGHLVAKGTDWALVLKGDSVTLFNKAVSGDKRYAIISSDLALNGTEETWSNKDGVFQFVLSDTVCVDSVSQTSASYQVKGRLGDVHLVGCAADVYDLRINGRWRLIEVNGRPLPSGDKSVLPATLEINGETHQLKGVTVCKSLQSKVFIRGNRLHTVEWYANASACSDLADALMSSVIGKNMTYVVTEQNLLLDNGQGKRLYFVRF